MMNNLKNTFYQICKENYSNLGYTKQGKSFVRIVGDMVQTFTFVKFPTRPSCTVFFSIYPLCLSGTISLDFQHYRLDNLFLESDSIKYGGWYVDLSSEESIKKCIRQLTDAIDCHIIPLFERCIDCKVSLRELLKLEDSFDRIRKEQLKIWGSEDCAELWFKRCLFDCRLYYLALKSHNAAFARMYLEHNIASYYEKTKDLDRYQDLSLAQRSRQKYENKLEQLKLHLSHIIEKDMSYFDSILQENENRNIEYLTKKYPRLKIGDRGQGDGSEKTGDGSLS